MKRGSFSSGPQSNVSHPWHPGTSGAQLSSGYLFANKLHMLDIILHQATVLDVDKSRHCFKRLLYLIDFVVHWFQIPKQSKYMQLQELIITKTIKTRNLMEGSEMNKTCNNAHSKKLDTKQIANAIGIFQCLVGLHCSCRQTQLCKYASFSREHCLANPNQMTTARQNNSAQFMFVVTGLCKNYFGLGLMTLN